jgi:TolB-like protein
MNVKTLGLLALMALIALPLSAQEKGKDKKAKDDAPSVYPVAIFPFQERGNDVKGQGAKITDILFANLVTDPQLMLVDREEIRKLLDEQELSLSGLANPAEANKVGQLTGAKLLISGSVVQSDTTIYLVAKVISTETGRVLGASVKGTVRDKLDDLVTSLAEKVTATIGERGSEIMPTIVTREDRLAALKKETSDSKKPTVIIKIAERHVGQATIDPAAETEIAIWCKELGFEVLDAQLAGAREADILITGEGFSEFATRIGNLISVKSRLEIKAVERKTGKTLAVDREVTVAVNLSEQLAGKGALQDAAANIAERLVPKLAGGESDEKPAKKRAKE